MIIGKDGKYFIGKLKLDTKRQGLWLVNEFVQLSKQRFDFLLYLIQNDDRILTKDELLADVWKGIYVEENRIAQIVGELRNILGNDAIITIPKKGYRFNPEYFVEKSNLPCPWKGLRYYDKDDEDYFCGRDDDVNEIIGRLRTNPLLLTLTGSSGVGKTSLVKAGLIPKLKKGEDIEESNQWKFLSLRPTHHPLFKLSRKIASLKYPDSNLTDEIIDPIIKNLEDDPKLIVQELAAIPGLKLFLFVDQIETLLSKEVNQQEAEIFVEFLLELSKNKKITQAIILGLRRDFYDSFCDKFKKLSPLITRNMHEISELTENQLKEVIVEPARLHGLEVEKGLSDEIVGEIINEKTSHPGVLPLLSNFLVELFKCREGNKITFTSYHKSGGIKDSISRYADKVFEKLSDAQKPLAEKLLILLADVGAKPGMDSCRHMRAGSILMLFEKKKEKEEVQNIIQTLIEKRLLVSWNDPQNNVELPHASLIRNWTKMQRLLSEKRRVIRFTETLKSKTKNWLRGDKNTDDLLKGSELQTAIDLYEQYISLIGQNEKDYYSASVSAKSDEENRERKEKNKKKWLKVTIVTLVAVLVVIGSLLRYYQWVNKKSNAAKIAADAQTELDKNPANALRLAIKAAEMDETEDTVAVLQAATAGSHLWKSLKGHTASLMAIAVSNDGGLLVTASRDKTARLWNANTGQLLYILTGHTGGVEWASFSPDGKYVATASSDWTVRIWDVSNGKEIKKLGTEKNDDKKKNGINNVVFSPDGKLILTAEENGTASIWDYTSGEKLFILSHPKGPNSENQPLNSAIFSPDGKLVVTGSMDKTAIIWDISTKEKKRILRHPGSVLNFAFSPDGKVLATACGDGVTRIWNVEDWSLQRELRGHQGRNNCAVFDRIGERLVTTSLDRTAIIWDWRKGENLLSLKGHTGSITSAVFSPNGRFIYTSSGDTEAGIWKISEDFDVTRLDGHSGEVYENSYSLDGEMLITAGKDMTARLWRVESGELLKIFTHTSAVRSAKFSPDAKLIASATEDGKIHLWEAESGKILREFSAADNQIYSTLFDSTGKIIASGGEDGIVRLWDISSGKEINTFDEKKDHEDVGVTRLAYSRDGKILAASGTDRSVKFWDVDASNALDPWLVGTGIINSVSFGINNNTVLVSGLDGSLRVWDREEKKQLSVLLGHTRKINYAEYSRDGSFIVSASADNTVRIWSARLQRELYRIEASTIDTLNDSNKDNAAVLYASFSPNGKNIVYSTNLGSVRIIHCPICSVSARELIKIAKSRIPLE